MFGFAWIGSNFVSCLARSTNKIYGVPNRRFVHQRPRDFAVVIVMAVLLLASGRVQILSYALSVLAAMVLLCVLYRVVPKANQTLRDVWPGAVTASLLFVLLVQVVPLYVLLIGGVNRFGLAFALVTLLVAWFYLLAHVLLFGSYVNAPTTATANANAPSPAASSPVATDGRGRRQAADSGHTP